jgi:Eukaryotic protein of unknown function (DUF1764)
MAKKKKSAEIPIPAPIPAVKKLSSSFIDDLFSSKKKPKSSPPSQPEPIKTKSTSEQPTKKIKGNSSDLFGTAYSDSNKLSNKRTEEGWPVYRLEDLNLSNTGGDTADCPFDCNCCF